MIGDNEVRERVCVHERMFWFGVQILSVYH